MTCFRDLFARYPDKVMELCLEEAYDDHRNYCYLADNGPPWADTCALCDRLAFDDGARSGWHEANRLCQDPECHRLWFWIRASGRNRGTVAREALQKHFGTRSIFDVPHDIRREAILAAMLTVEALEKARENGRKPRLRVAAQNAV